MGKYSCPCVRQDAVKGKGAMKAWALIYILAVGGCSSNVMQHVDEQFGNSPALVAEGAMTSASAPTRTDSASSATADEPSEVRSNRFAVKPADPPPMFRPQANLSIYRYSAP